MSFKTRTKLSDLLKPLREPSQTSMVSLSVVMCIFATLGLLSYFAPILDEMEENRMPLLTANRDEVSNSCQVVVHSDLWALDLFDLLFSIFDSLKGERSLSRTEWKTHHWFMDWVTSCQRQSSEESKPSCSHARFFRFTELNLVSSSRTESFGRCWFPPNKCPK